MLLVALAVIPLALACGPGTGPITDRPTMKFSFSPPLAWTYNTVVAEQKGGQSLSRASAQSRIDSDIEYAVIKAVESYGYSTAGVIVQNAVAAELVKIDPACTAVTVKTNPPTCVPEGEAVSKECTGPATTDTAVHRHDGVTITITSPVALAQSNWENMATKVWASLTANAGVKFYGPIEVVV